MKLHCTTDSIRIQLRRSEVGQLLTHGKVIDRIDFPSGFAFEFSLCLEETAQQISAQFQPPGLQIIVPLHLGRQWGNSDMVGLEAEETTFGNRRLLLSIEKEFQSSSWSENDVTGNLQTDSNTIS